MQSDSEWPISPVLQLFQSFPTEIVQNDSEQPISPDFQLFQSFPIELAQNDSEQPISPDLQLFQSFPTKAVQNSEQSILPVYVSTINGLTSIAQLGVLKMSQKFASFSF